MKEKFLNFIVLLVTTTIVIFVPNSSSACNQTCGGYKLNYPLGTSSDCPIQLNCSSNGTLLLSDLTVQSVNHDTILVNLPATCGRPVSALRRLFTANYAPTNHNGILLHNCTTSNSTCLLPTTMLQTNFEMLDCNARNDSINCYSERGNSNTTSFIDYESMIGTSGCRFLFSGISMESFENSSSISLDVQVLRIGWWMRGDCRCSDNSRCVRVVAPIEGNTEEAYRCHCVAGYDGDGFRDGLGCRRDQPEVCTPPNYLSGQCGGTTRVGVLVGGVAAGAALMIGLGLVLCCIRKRSKLRSRSRRSRQLCKTTGITIPIHPYKEMEKATGFFSDKRRLGNGAYGTVYSGKLNNEEWVAIKRIRNRDSDSTEQVINEIKLLSSVSHPNLVRLLGCCIENEEQILVYEFMPNGTLSQHLQRENGNGSLPWPIRLSIAAETAQAISYLHNATNPPIYHRDIKSSNILLDHVFKSKVADFGLSRLGLVESSHISTAPQGTPGYLDPQYHQHFHLSDKSDVYSFGVVLVEIITALKVVDFARPQNEVNLAALAVDRIGRGCLEELIDPSLKLNLDSWSLSSLHKVAELAFRCLAFHQDMRPSMMEVAIELEQIRLSNWTNLPEVSVTGSSGESSRSSNSSNLSEKPLNLSLKKQEFDSVGELSSTSSMNTVADFSPVSVQDSWQSDRSSPSSNSLLNHVTQ